ncbi:MAG: shikimate kinase AroK [Gammaproteobacteria bacterium]|nr:shikimate kinase AroK [Gammaproteobacteria bacterium]
MPAPDRVFLVGPMGAGKTAVGRRLAALLDYTFHDADQYIETRTGVDIGFIFEKEGEAGFRQRECQAIDELTQMPRIVLATGGGAVVSDQNRHNLATRGYVIYLRTSVSQQYERTRMSRTRPLLDTEDPQQRLRELLEQRGPLYEEVADLRISTDRRYVKSVAREIYRTLTR